MAHYTLQYQKCRRQAYLRWRFRDSIYRTHQKNILDLNRFSAFRYPDVAQTS
jgi:hypothetical protein